MQAPTQENTQQLTSLSPEIGRSKKRAPCKHPPCPIASLKTGSLARGHQMTLKLHAQKSSAAAGQPQCQHGDR